MVTHWVMVNCEHVDQKAPEPRFRQPQNVLEGMTASYEDSLHSDGYWVVLASS